MTESEAIKLLKSNRPTSGYITLNYLKWNEALKMAINALEKQAKIKEAFTHYSFSGYKFDVYNVCMSALSEIKSILWSE